MCWVDENGGGILPPLKAAINSYSLSPNLLNTTGSLGELIRGKIYRDDNLIEVIPQTDNIGSAPLSYNTTLQNGDCIKVETAYGNFNGLVEQDEKCIPTAGVGFIIRPNL